MIEPHQFLRSYLGDANNVFLPDEDGNPVLDNNNNRIPIPVFSVAEVNDRITIPAIIMDPTFEAGRVETYRGVSRQGLGFTVDCKASTFGQASMIRSIAMAVLNNEVNTEHRVYSPPQITYAELQPLSTSGADPIFNCSFDVAIRF